MRETEHDVGDDAGEGDIKPDGECPAGDFAVQGDAAGEREKEGDENERESQRGQDDVAGEERKIEDAECGVNGIANVAVESMVEDVADEEEGGEGKGREHGRAMSGDAMGANEDVTDENGSSAEAVEDSVEAGQEGKANAGCVSRGMDIDQPEKEERRGSADEKDGGDGGGCS